MKRVYQWILTITLLTCLIFCMAIGVSAEEVIASGTCGDNVTWSLDPTGRLTISGTGAMYDFTEDGAPWSKYAFNNINTINTINTIVIEDGVTHIGNFAFSECGEATSVSISDSVTSIGHFAFWCCVNLLNVTIPENVTCIGDYAFAICQNLSSVTIPNSVTSIGEDVFRDCWNLKCNIYDNAKYLGNSEDPFILLLESINDSIFFCNIHTNTKFIHDDAFRECVMLNTITIPENVNSIGSAVFWKCNALSSVTISDGVTSIGGSAFGECSSLTSITIPGSIQYLGSYTFSDCVNLKEIIFEGNAPECIELTAFNAVTANAYYSKRYDTWTESVLQNYGGTISWIPYEIESGICGENLTWYLDPTGRLTISGTGAMYDFTEDGAPWSKYVFNTINTIVIEDGVTHIGNFAFSQCGASSISLGNTVTSIGAYSFYGCPYMNSITIPDSITSIGIFAFSQCSNLTGMQVDENNPVFSSDSYGVLFDKEKTKLIVAPGKITGTYSIPDGITGIEEYAFFNCSSLSVITIPDGITTIGNLAFANCLNLSQIIFKGNAPEGIASNAFQNVRALSYYPSGMDTWTEDVRCSYGGVLSWTGYEGPGGFMPAPEPDETEPEATEPTEPDVTSPEVTEPVPTEPNIDKPVENWNISLDGYIRIHFYINKDIPKTAMITVTVKDSHVNYFLSSLKKTEEGCYVITVNLTAAQLNDAIIIQVVNGEDLGKALTYTAHQYCNIILTDEDFSQYHALVKEMLNYGAAAQVYFGYDTENLANDGITGVANTEIPETVEELTIADKITGFDFYGASLVYRDRIAVRYYFTGDVTGKTFTANGNTYTPVAKDDMYYVEIADILPQDLDQQITLTVTDANDNTLSVTYGPMNYIVRMNKKGNDALKALVKALYNYHLAAKALSA